MFTTAGISSVAKRTEICPYHGWLLEDKGNQLLTHTTTWMDLKGITLSERQPVPKGYILCDSISTTFFNDHFRDGGQVSGCWGFGRRGQRMREARHAYIVRGNLGDPCV